MRKCLHEVYDPSGTGVSPYCSGCSVPENVTQTSVFEVTEKQCYKCLETRQESDFYLERPLVCKVCNPTLYEAEFVCVSCKQEKKYKKGKPLSNICHACISAQAKKAGAKRSTLMVAVYNKRARYIKWKKSLPSFLRRALENIPTEQLNREYTVKQLRMLEYNPRRAARLKAAPTNFTYDKWIQKVNYYGWRCVYCNKHLDLENLTMDHVKPLSKQGTHFISNLVPACWQCNGEKLASLQWKLEFRPKTGFNLG